jgi:hypothetical protein
MESVNQASFTAGTIIRGRAERGVRMLVAAAVVALAVAGGCNRSGGNGSPRTVAKAYVQAMVSGDGQAIRDASVGDEGSAQLLTAQAKQNAAYERLAAAAKKQFGDANTVLAGRRATDHFANRLATIDAEPESITTAGDEAAVGEGSAKIWLRRVGDAWKVDRVRQVMPGDAADYLPLVDGIRRAHEEVAAGIEAGTYPTAEEAKADLFRKTSAAVRASTKETVPATRPSTRVSATTRAAE